MNNSCSAEKMLWCAYIDRLLAYIIMIGIPRGTADYLSAKYKSSKEDRKC